MGMTAVEKILARASGSAVVQPEDFVTAKVDLVMMQDLSGPRRVEPILRRLGVGVWNPERIVLISDHCVPAIDATSAEILNLSRGEVYQSTPFPEHLRRMLEAGGLVPYLEEAIRSGRIKPAPPPPLLSR